MAECRTRRLATVLRSKDGIARQRHGEEIESIAEVKRS